MKGSPGSAGVPEEKVEIYQYPPPIELQAEAGYMDKRNSIDVMFSIFGVERRYRAGKDVLVSRGCRDHSL